MMKKSIKKFELKEISNSKSIKGGNNIGDLANSGTISIMRPKDH